MIQHLGADTSVVTASQQLPAAGSTWVHFKGGAYEVVATALDSETQAAVIVYRSQQTGQLWVRAAAAFLETVVVDGTSMPRFTVTGSS